MPEGVCRCGQLSREGRKTCASCAAEDNYRSARSRAQRKEQGLCIACGSKPVEAPHAVCVACRIRLVKYQGKRQRAFRAEGKCVWCGAAPEEGKWRCTACLEQQRIMGARYRQRQKKAG